MTTPQAFPYELPDDWEVYRVDVPYPKDWPLERVREHLEMVLQDAAKQAATVNFPPGKNDSQ